MLIRHLAQDDWQLARAMMRFADGNLGDRGWRHVLLVLPLSVIGGMMAWSWSPHMDLLQTGDDEARSLGLHVAQTQRWLMVWAAVLVAATVSVAGAISFVGLVVRIFAAPLKSALGHRLLVPMAALGVLFLLLVCDVLAQLPGPGQRLPLGLVSGLLGAPLFVGVL